MDITNGQLLGLLLALIWALVLLSAWSRGNRPLRYLVSKWCTNHAVKFSDLVDATACWPAQKRFIRCFGNGAAITLENVERALGENLDIAFLIRASLLHVNCDPRQKSACYVISVHQEAWFDADSVQDNRKRQEHAVHIYNVMASLHHDHLLFRRKNK